MFHIQNKRRLGRYLLFMYTGWATPRFLLGCTCPAGRVSRVLPVWLSVKYVFFVVLYIHGSCVCSSWSQKRLWFVLFKPVVLSVAYCCITDHRASLIWNKKNPASLTLTLYHRSELSLSRHVQKKKGDASCRFLSWKHELFIFLQVFFVLLYSHVS